ncbi:MAG: hypothetical protein Q9179_001273 [Wetmoreana sp. 5 TL-2023]
MAESRGASFLPWAAAQGIITRGIEYRKIADRGLGIVAQRNLEAGEQLVKVPFSALLTTEVIARSFRRQHKQTTVHCLLASFLTTGGSVQSSYGPWASTWPTLQEFRASVPLCWQQSGSAALSEELLDETKASDGVRLPFPPAMCLLLQEQKRKLRADWEAISNIRPETSFERFIYYWLIVNTRSFYFEMPNVKKHPRREDRMALCPFIDLFNHNDSGCNVQFGEGGFIVTSEKAYEAGEEICVSYGQHSNDFLLIEYGFVLNNNRWDSTSLDHILMKRFMGTQAEKQLQEAGYLGGYTLSHEGFCYRTEVAVRTQTLTEADWEGFVAGLKTDRIENERKAKALIASQVLEPFLLEAEGAIKWLHSPSRRPTRACELLFERWHQIESLLKAATESLTVANSHPN